MDNIVTTQLTSYATDSTSSESKTDSEDSLHSDSNSIVFHALIVCY